MANKNTKRRNAEYVKACKKAGHFPTGGFKARRGYFPKGFRRGPGGYE